MSFLAHMCQYEKCGHLDFHHHPRALKEGKCSYGHCWCPADSFDPEPVVIETFNFETREPEELLEPGSVWNAGTVHQQVMCACERCQQRYRELVSS